MLVDQEDIHHNCTSIRQEIVSFANHLIRTHLIPQKAVRDALHVAIAATHGMNYLLTWNCSHINNAEMTPRIAQACHKAGYRCPVICTPEELMGE